MANVKANIDESENSHSQTIMITVWLYILPGRNPRLSMVSVLGLPRIIIRRKTMIGVEAFIVVIARSSID